MNEILEFIADLLPLIDEEFDENDPDKIGAKTSKYISEKLNIALDNDIEELYD